ncbi:fibroblast growth factor binding protein 2a [Kryptolebias marmoratus]|uniref:fibroblast growth factor binding protein 2a n=1 Tax=Kryptolebias marmoratus TaxID=37003 RepID=UPI0007F8F844|nr:fibroblast growth factor binding protein 2a [Kryptolebias marmoratus]
MWIRATALLLAFFLWPSEAQSDGGRKPSIWDEPIKFTTKNKDKCTMIITGQGENTNLRLSCQGVRRYWCDFVGKPHTCSAYNKNPRHYFVQMMWTLRKLPNACRGPRQIKPHMCRKASDDSLMVLRSVSFSKSQPDASYRAAARPSKQSARSQTAPGPARRNWKAVRPLERVKTTQRSSPTPTTPPAESNPKRMARQYCWRSMQGICSAVIGWFRS